MSFLSNFFQKKPSSVKEIQRYSPQQNEIMDQLMQMASSQLSGGNFDFAPIEQQARTNFTQTTIPSIMERFYGGSGGDRMSSGLGYMLSQAGTGLEQGLAAQKQGYNMQMLPMLQNLLGMGLQQRFDPLYRKGSPSPFSSMLAGAAPAMGKAGGNLLGSGIPNLLSLLF